LTKPYQKWRDDCVVFLDDCFASDSAVATLAPYFELRDFRIIFPDEKKGKQNGLGDTPVIRKCHEEKWLLLTTDHEMGRTHVEEIKKNPNVTILATAHNSASPEEYRTWLAAVIKLKPKILRMYKKETRPWFATFSREGNITSFKTITTHHTTRRTRRK
jgi:hypothetical protein